MSCRTGYLFRAAGGGSSLVGCRGGSSSLRGNAIPRGKDEITLWFCCCWFVAVFLVSLLFHGIITESQNGLGQKEPSSSSSPSSFYEMLHSINKAAASTSMGSFDPVNNEMLISFETNTSVPLPQQLPFNQSKQTFKYP